MAELRTRGGLYAKLRELTFSDAILGLALVALVGVTWNTDRNVASLVEAQKREVEQQRADPVVRTSTFVAEKERTREKLGEVDGRLRKLEETRGPSSN